MADELTPEEVEELRVALLVMERELVHTMVDTTSRNETVDLDQPIGRLSRMDAMQQAAMATAELRRQEVRLKQVRAALKAIEAETYGDCRRCAEPIGVRRLRARPESPFCLACMTHMGG